MKTRHLLLLTGLAGAAWLAIFGDKSPDTEVADPATRQSGVTLQSPAATDVESATGSSSQAEAESQTPDGEAEIHILALRPRADLIAVASGRHEPAGLFSGRSWTPPPTATAKQAPPPAPSAPPLPFTYLGKQTSNGRTEVFLASGDNVIVVGEHSVIRDTYRVDSIKPPLLSMTYLPLNQAQQISIGAIN